MHSGKARHPLSSLIPQRYSKGHLSLSIYGYHCTAATLIDGASLSSSAALMSPTASRVRCSCRASLDELLLSSGGHLIGMMIIGMYDCVVSTSGASDSPQQVLPFAYSCQRASVFVRRSQAFNKFSVRALPIRLAFPLHRSNEELRASNRRILH